MTYQIKLPQFEGPFDLLLFFIERDEIDIYDIQITQLANDFLAYIHEMKILNIELASEFILVAATLMRIKAKMLLPRKELDESGEEIDPRQELVQRLLEYKQFKSIVSTLHEFEKERHLRHDRGNIIQEIKHISGKYSTEAELENLHLFKLLTTFNKVLTRFHDRENKPALSVVKYPYTIKQEREYIVQYITKNTQPFFTEIFANCDNRIHAIFRFLALLELLQEKLVWIRLGIGINNFWIQLYDEQAEPNNLDI